MNDLPINLESPDLLLLLAANAVYLLTAAIILSPAFGRLNVAVNWKRLRNLGLAASALFLSVLIARVFLSNIL